MKKAVIVIIILAIVGIFIWRVGVAVKSRAEAGKTTEEALIVVDVETAKLGTIENKLSFVGNIVADAEVTVFPKTMGRIEKMMVKEGSNVSKGSVLARLEDKELSLRVKQAEVALETAKTGYSQAKALSEIRVRSQVAQAEAGLLGADAALKQVKDMAKTRVSSQLDQAQAGLDALKTNLKKIKDGARPEEIKQIELAVEQAKAGKESADTDLERMEKLYKEGAISKQTIDGIRTRATVANAQYEAAKQQLKLVQTGARAEDIQAMELQVKAAEAGLEMARSAADTRSWEQDIEMAQSRYNQAKAGLDGAKSLVDAKSWEAEIIGAEAGVKQAETALELAKEALSYAVVTAPISGTISQRNLDEGGMANPAMPIFTIVNANNVKAVIEVPEANLKDISIGKKAYISASGLSEPIEGQITLISPVIKPASRTASIEISIDNSSRKLKPGAFANISIPLDIRDNAIIARRSSVLEEKENGKIINKYVFIVNNNKAVRKNVEIGIEQGDIVEVVSGIQVGDKIIVAGQNLVQNDGKVKVMQVKQ
jgi:RND family efflux transporter MFP subunit